MEEQLKRNIEHQVLQDQFKERYHGKLALKTVRSGVESYLAEAKELKLKVGLASSSRFHWISSHLQNLNLLHEFQCIKTADDVEIVKPDPALYLKAAACLGLAAEECLVFEDSANGALAAKWTGMNCVIVPNEVTHTMVFCDVEHRLSSMSDMSLREVIDFVNKRKTVN